LYIKEIQTLARFEKTLARFEKSSAGSRQNFGTDSPT
jgi:hypothetical protein